MGDDSVIDWVCDECSAHHFQCCECGEETIGSSEDEMCDRCFNRLVPSAAVVRTLRDVLEEPHLSTALAGLKRDFGQRGPR
jgi:hypothetical protein